MKRFRLCCVFFLIGLLVSDLCSQEIKATAVEKRILSGVDSAEVIDDRILVPLSGKIDAVPCAVVSIESAYKFTRIRARCNGTKIDGVQLSDSRILYTKPGKYELEITGFDPEKGIDDQELAFEIGGEVPPTPGPDPAPDPDQPGKFDNLAAKVSAIAKQMSADNKKICTATIEHVVGQMKSYRFKQIAEARAYIATQKNLFDARLYEFLKNDSAGRILGFDQAVAYYEEVLRGLK